jgi:hypothetical protein
MRPTLPLAAPLALALAVLPAPAPAGGEMTLDFPDAPGRFVPVPGGAGLTRFRALDAIGIDGQAGRARLVIEIALPPGAGPLDAPLDARVSFRPAGFRDYWQTTGPLPSGAIALDTVALSGPSPRIAGRFRVVLCRRASAMAPADPGDCHPAAGRFDTTLQID